MTIITQATSDHKIAEIITEEIILSSTEDALDLIGNLKLSGFRQNHALLEAFLRDQKTKQAYAS